MLNSPRGQGIFGAIRDAEPTRPQFASSFISCVSCRSSAIHEKEADRDGRRDRLIQPTKKRWSFEIECDCRSASNPYANTSTRTDEAGYSTTIGRDAKTTFESPFQ
jgi:hypothetical protein